MGEEQGRPGYIAWVSLDPVNPAINPYPAPFNLRLEEAYQRHNANPHATQSCALGLDFFNSTIHFDKSTGNHSQTTPSIHLGPRMRSKPAGFRDVRRLEVSEGQPDLSLKAATHNLQEDGEWRIISDSSPSMRDLSLKIDERFLIKQTNAENDEGVTSRTVVPIEPLVPIWQWCMDIEDFGASSTSAYNRPDERWGTYHEKTCEQIELAYEANQSRFDIELGARDVTIEFCAGNRIFAVQIDRVYHKQRHVRRKLVPERESKILLNQDSSGALDDVCAICLAHFQQTANWPVVKAPCGHVFHSCCVQILQDKRENKCPLCRAAVEWGTHAPSTWADFNTTASVAGAVAAASDPLLDTEPSAPPAEPSVDILLSPLSLGDSAFAP